MSKTDRREAMMDLAKEITNLVEETAVEHGLSGAEVMGTLETVKLAIHETGIVEVMGDK